MHRDSASLPLEYSAEQHNSLTRIWHGVGKMVTTCVFNTWADSWCTTHQSDDQVLRPVLDIVRVFQLLVANDITSE